MKYASSYLRTGTLGFRGRWKFHFGHVYLSNLVLIRLIRLGTRCTYACLQVFLNSMDTSFLTRSEELKRQALFIAEHVVIAGTSFENMAIQRRENDQGVHRNQFRNLPALFILAWLSISEQSGSHKKSDAPFDWASE
jgi:hypothetical protein